MNNFKIKAALFTFWWFLGGAAVIALGQLARAYQGTEELRIAGIAICVSGLAYLMYRIKLSNLESDAAVMREIAARIRAETSR